MVADGGYNRSAENPFACRFLGVIVINCAAAGVKPVNCIGSSIICALGYGFIKLSVIKARKGIFLIDYT